MSIIITSTLRPRNVHDAQPPEICFGFVMIDCVDIGILLLLLLNLPLYRVDQKKKKILLHARYRIVVSAILCFFVLIGIISARITYRIEYYSCSAIFASSGVLCE